MDTTTIIVIATIHQFHLKSQFYSLGHLKTMIERINPDVICVELTAKDLKDKKDQAVKVEYPKCIIPLAEKKGYILIPMEPNEPEYSRIVNKSKQTLKKIESKEPTKLEIFSLYIKSLLDYLFTYWNSPVEVNSQLTNALFEVKHKFQNSLFGLAEEQGWNEWNNHFLNTILETAEAYKDKKILVTVGVEHVYWLKRHLRSKTTIRLVDEVIKWKNPK